MDDRPVRWTLETSLRRERRAVVSLIAVVLGAAAMGAAGVRLVATSGDSQGRLYGGVYNIAISAALIFSACLLIRDRLRAASRLADQMDEQDVADVMRS